MAVVVVVVVVVARHVGRQADSLGVVGGRSSRGVAEVHCRTAALCVCMRGTGSLTPAVIHVTKKAVPVCQSGARALVRPPRPPHHHHTKHHDHIQLLLIPPRVRSALCIRPPRTLVSKLLQLELSSGRGCQSAPVSFKHPAICRYADAPQAAKSPRSPFTSSTHRPRPRPHSRD